MKTPREILFESHRRTEPKLDAVRQNVLGELFTTNGAPAGTTGAPAFSRLTKYGGHKSFFGARKVLSRLRVAAPPLFRKAWLELIWPSRRAWAAMAALWLVVFVANHEMKTTVSGALGTRSAPARELAQAFEEQRRLLAELLPPAKRPVAEAPRVQAPRPNPGPRSEGPVPFKAC